GIIPGVFTRFCERILFEEDAIRRSEDDDCGRAKLEIELNIAIKHPDNAVIQVTGNLRFNGATFAVIGSSDTSTSLRCIYRDTPFMSTIHGEFIDMPGRWAGSVTGYLRYISNDNIPVPPPSIIRNPIYISKRCIPEMY